MKVGEGDSGSNGSGFLVEALKHGAESTCLFPLSITQPHGEPGLHTTLTPGEQDPGAPPYYEDTLERPPQRPCTGFPEMVPLSFTPSRWEGSASLHGWHEALCPSPPTSCTPAPFGRPRTQQLGSKSAGSQHREDRVQQTLPLACAPPSPVTEGGPTQPRGGRTVSDSPAE